MRDLTTYISTPQGERRPDEHGLRCEFRRAVNAGLMPDSSYETFVAYVDRIGGLKNLRLPLELPRG